MEIRTFNPPQKPFDSRTSGCRRRPLSGENDLCVKLAKLAKVLHQWGRKLNVTFKRDIKEAYSKLNLLRQPQDQIAAPTYEEERLRILAILLKEEDHWRQRAKAHWLKEGDRNTKFFHAFANGRRKVNRIDKLKNDHGTWAEDPLEIRSLVTDHFNRTFSASSGNPSLITNLMHPDKSPGPDGFNPRFFQKKWGILGDEIFFAGKQWLENGALPEGINNTIIALIPKVDSPTTLKDYRPIALCNVIMKIVTKVLANRIKPILPSLISANQTAFVKDKLITDNIIIAFEMLHSMHRNTRKKQGEMAIKVDVSKAYDRLNWDFLRQMLLALGFSLRWTNMIMLTVETVEYFVKGNNELIGPISPKRGIRQGDPLSPYLFIICMEGLSAYLKAEESVGRIHGCKAARGALAISHLFFADDAFFFCRATVDEVRHLKHMLTTYEEASGQAINYAKSGIMGSNNLAPDLIHGFSQILGIHNPINTGRYLGLPSLVGRKPFSSAGKATLIKAVAQAISSYYMNVFLILDSTIQKLERMINSFWWGRNLDGPRSVNWLSWDKLCIPQAYGGLGFRDFTAFNLAMLGKQGWRLISNPTSLVSHIIKAKYYPHGNFMKAHLGNSPSFIWRSIWHSQLVLEKGLRWKVGNGLSINVWNDSWIRDDSNFKIETSINPSRTNLTVRELMDPQNLRWNVDLIHQLLCPRDCAKILQIPFPSVSREDKLIWHWTQDGNYSVKSRYRTITETLAPTRHLFVNGDWKLNWKSNIPNKVKYFVWRALREILPTRSALQTRGIQVSPLCPLCNRNIENVWHALVDCPSIRPIWQEAGVLDTLDQKALYVTSFQELTFGYLKENPGELGEKFLMTLWSIWHRRNDILWIDGPHDPSLATRRANQILTDWKASKSLSALVNDYPNQACVTTWTPPRRGFIKCNVDAAIFHSNVVAGFGAVLRNSNGEFIAAKATPINSLPSVRECEALAIFDALLWVSNREDSNVIIQSDAKVVVDAIYTSTTNCSEFGDIINNIRCILNTRPSFSVHAIKRQANEMAHLTARHSCNLACSSIFHTVPTFLNHCNCNNSSIIPINESNDTIPGDGNAEAR
ncbi:hypothetical protein OSB04_011371 [Centaurea solstitialis]|uniref:Reverse transcriptase domain-containing protein n=1 Tax=Centaurea solstitialis TaxID=347529 RepID=A0AA38WDM0_9ASTR|nr:hypothetical protein OSB04_011371 [Centaurea solstitialis]